MNIHRISTLVTLTGLAIAATTCAVGEAPTSIPTTRSPLRAGLRASPYGIRPFPNEDWWQTAALTMSNNFAGTAPVIIWIVGTVNDDYVWLNFPKPADAPDYNKILFDVLDTNETFLNRFDQAGIKVWLQVEPASADITTLIALILNRYAHHACVIGFGIDVEWLQNKHYPEGKAVTDEEAKLWVEQIRSINPEYQLFLKHWLVEKMPPSYRDGVTFVDDSQQFGSLDEMSQEFIAWGQAFAPAPVGFQFGYAADRKWWKLLANPPQVIGQKLLETVPNTSDLIWVDFTAREIWP